MVESLENETERLRLKSNYQAQQNEVFIHLELARLGSEFWIPELACRLLRSASDALAVPSVTM